MAAPASLVFFGDSLTDNGNLFALAGIPQAPYVNGVFSNGPTYAAPSNLPALLHKTSANFAYGGARAHGTQFVNNTDINFGGRVAHYLAGPHGPHEIVFVNLGSNDYLNYNPATDGDAATFVKGVVQSIGNGVNAIAGAGGVDEVVLYTIPNVALAPAKAALTPVQIAGATAIVAGHNGGIYTLAAVQEALGIHTVVVDVARLQVEFTKDADTFGLKTTDIPFVSPDAQGVEQSTGVLNFLRPDQVAYFDEIHPSAAVHGIAAVFSAATLKADQVFLFDGGAQTLVGTAGSDLVFTGRGNDGVSTEGGNDTILAGLGKDVVHSGDGNDIAIGGGGNDRVFGGNGSDVLAGNLGNDKLYGGNGSDVLISGQGTDFAYGGNGNDIMIFSQDLQVAGHDTFGGGNGIDTVRVIVDEFALFLHPEIQLDLAAFGSSIAATHHGVLTSLGLTANNVERLEVYIQHHDGSITAGASFGHAAVAETPVVHSLLHSADLWGLL